jgi:hypothetical protein
LQTAVNIVNIVRFQVLILAAMKIAVWDVVPCRVVEIEQHFRGDDIPVMEAVSASEMSVSFYQTTQHNIPEESHCHSQHEHYCATV